MRTHYLHLHCNLFAGYTLGCKFRLRKMSNMYCLSSAMRRKKIRLRNGLVVIPVKKLSSLDFRKTHKKNKPEKLITAKIPWRKVRRGIEDVLCVSAPLRFYYLLALSAWLSFILFDDSERSKFMLLLQ